VGRVIKAADVIRRTRKIGPEHDVAAVELVESRAEALRIRIEARDQVIKLALEMARKIVGRAVELDEKIINDIYRQALSSARDLKNARVLVHPDDRQKSRVDELAGKYYFFVEEDLKVGRAGCRVIAGDVEVDATLEGVLGALEQSLRETTND
jgi:flagellar biosynthesis/type III secretory pathway protein FliH